MSAAERAAARAIVRDLLLLVWLGLLLALLAARWFGVI